MNSIQNELLAAINTNDLRAIETVLNGLGVEAAVEDDFLYVDGFGIIVFDNCAQDTSKIWICHGMWERPEWPDTKYKQPEDLAAMLAEFCKQEGA